MPATSVTVPETRPSVAGITDSRRRTSAASDVVSVAVARKWQRHDRDMAVRARAGEDGSGEAGGARRGEHRLDPAPDGGRAHV
jgi:hypothetical protein